MSRKLRTDGWQRKYATYKEYDHSRHKEYKEKVLDEIILKLGNKCLCCGERERKFLTLDHINNDGFKDRKQNRKWPRSSYSMYLKVRREKCNKNKYQLLCMNCNHGKARNKGVCPHAS